jgi:hypothetical protein
MTFRWSRDGAALTSRCVLCGLTTRALSETAIHTAQRAHTWQTCRDRRVETAAAGTPEGMAAARKWAGYELREMRRGTVGLVPENVGLVIGRSAWAKLRRRGVSPDG